MAAAAPCRWRTRSTWRCAPPNGDGWRLDGGLTSVPYGPLAGATLLEADLSTGGRGLFLVPAEASGLRWTALESLDLSYDTALKELSPLAALKALRRLVLIGASRVSAGPRRTHRGRRGVQRAGR